ncbi:MAG: alpha-2-macroglobulin family protein, partial [Chloroflexota bacterium]|nr:alpha-2-macroglobulin family protein [Chloroflexota bacterium]
QLANEVNTGNYKLTATLGNSTSELTVVVKHYVLPKFKVDAAADRPFYLPGEHVTGAVDVNYFFGKPVDEGQVVLTGYTFDVQLNEVFRIEGRTDADGHYDFAFDLPDYFVGGGLEDQLATFVVEVAVTDGAEHTERIHLNLPVARERLLIEAVPESGDLVPGVENIVYIVTATPDGTPVPAELTIWAEGQTFTAASGDYGLAEWRFTPSGPWQWQEIKITARDAQGHEATRIIVFEAQSYSPVLLRPERAIARVGETLHLDIFSPVGTGSLYLDIIREGQTVSTRALKPANGHAQADIDLTPDLYGTLELHAYTISQWGEIQRDSRLVIVDAPRDLDIAIRADADTYLPGATAALDFDVTGQDGAGVPSVLGVAVVDESVFALQEQDPGFLKLYFLLEKELMEPKYDIHGFTLPDAVLYPEETTAARTAQDEAAQASLAGTTVGGGHSLAVNTHDEGVRRLEERQSAILHTVGRGLLPLALLLPLAIAALAVSDLRRERVLGRSLLLVAALSVSFGVLLARLPLPDWIGRNLLERLGYLFDEFSYSDLGPGMLAMSVLLGSCAWIALVIRAIRQQEAVRGAALGLMLFYFVALLLLLFLGPTLAFNPPEWVAILLVLAVFLPPLACLVWAAGETWQRRPWPALGTFALVGLALSLPLFALHLSDTVGSFGGPAFGRQRGGFIGEPELDVGWAVGEGLLVEEALPMNDFMVAVPTEAPVAKSAESPAPVAESEAAVAQPQAPRLRQLFGETMAWLPELVTNDAGELHVDLPLYDNITTWRLTALAHSQDGRLGATTTGLRVFQDFFVDFDLPYAMTQHDEVALPVAVYNYLEQPQSVRLVLEEESWFELLDEPEKTLLIGAHDVEVVRFRVRVTATQGRYRPIVWAYGERMSDATTATHDVLITPDGKPFESTWSDRLGAEMLHTVHIPDAIIPGTTQVEVKVYPGIVSQLVEGMDAILQMPYGCFEQTTSATYPNALALDYMQTTGQTAPEVQLKAEQYLNLGYQRLTTFEVQGGGFSLFGDAPADRMLTAYGLM